MSRDWTKQFYAAARNQLPHLFDLTVIAALKSACDIHTSPQQSRNLAVCKTHGGYK